MRKISLLAAMLLIIVSITTAQIKSAQTGNWSDAATWTGGKVPSSSDDVSIETGQTVTIDVADAACKNLSVNGTITFPNVDARGITINGSITVNATGKVNTYSSGSPTAPRYHTITIKGDLKVTAGGAWDLRRGSNPNVGVATVVFDGTTISNIYLSLNAYSSSTEEFNSVTINKTGGAKVILKTGNLFINNNTSSSPTVLTLTSGIIETEGTSVWNCLRTSNDGIVGASSASYINGALGRGLSNTAGNLSRRDFPVGDAKGFRPVSLRASAGLATGHALIVQPISGSANNSSTFASGIDRVSAVRYYKVTYSKSGITNAAASVNVDTIGIAYGTGDGVAANNTNLRVAYSANDRATWMGVPQSTAHMTALTDPPKVIHGDLLANPLPVTEGGTPLYISLARMSGTNENTLIGTTAIEKKDGIPTKFNLFQNYPNPFNPETVISYQLSSFSHVMLKVYDVLGKEVATLMNELQPAGFYNFQLSTNNYQLTSGIYFYKLTAGNYTAIRKMLLLK